MVFKKGQIPWNKGYIDPILLKDIKISEADLHWLVGIFEGEGHVYNSIKYYYTEVGITNTDYSMIKEIKRILPFGYIYTEELKPPWNTKYRYRVGASSDVYNLLKLIQPHLKTNYKKAQVAKGIRTVCGEYNIKELKQ